MGEFNLDDYSIYRYVQESLRRNGVALIVNKRLHQYLGTISKMKKMILVRFQGKSFNITVIEVYAPTTDAKAEVDWFFEDLKHLLDLTSKKRCIFHHRGGQCKSRKSRDSWNNRQVWPWSTKWIRAKANRVLSREHAGHSKTFPTTQEMSLHMSITKWSILESDWLHSLQQKMEMSIQSGKRRPGGDCGSGHELLIQNSGLNWRKWENF